MVTKPLKELILRQELEYPYEALADQIIAKAEVRQLWSHQASQAASTIKETLSLPLLRALDLVQEKGASNWLTSLPIEEMGSASPPLRLGPLPNAGELCVWYIFLC